MRLVLYDEELHEALTIIEVPVDLFDFVRDHGRLLRIPIPIRSLIEIPEDRLAGAARASFRPPASTIRLESVHHGRDGRILFWYGYAIEPELALEVRAAFLPGQLTEVRRRERAAYLRGAFALAFR